MNEDGTMARLPELRVFANTHDLALISIEQLIEYRRRNERQLSRQAQTRIPNAYGQWQAFGYRHEIDGTEYIALVLGDVHGESVLTRLHSECLTGDVFGSLRCDCGTQLDAAMAAIAAEGRGVVLYLRGHEGRGVGLLSKLQAYELQDAGADTVDANTELGLPVDAREYSAGAQMLADLGVRFARCLDVRADAAVVEEVDGRLQDCVDQLGRRHCARLEVERLRDRLREEDPFTGQAVTGIATHVIAHRYGQQRRATRHHRQAGEQRRDRDAQPERRPGEHQHAGDDEAGKHDEFALREVDRVRGLVDQHEADGGTLQHLARPPSWRVLCRQPAALQS